jgi:hypothetical protein
MSNLNRKGNMKVRKRKARVSLSMILRYMGRRGNLHLFLISAPDGHKWLALRSLQEAGWAPEPV